MRSTVLSAIAVTWALSASSGRAAVPDPSTAALQGIYLRVGVLTQIFRGDQDPKQVGAVLEAEFAALAGLLPQLTESAEGRAWKSELDDYVAHWPVDANGRGQTNGGVTIGQGTERLANKLVALIATTSSWRGDIDELEVAKFVETETNRFVKARPKSVAGFALGSVPPEVAATFATPLPAGAKLVTFVEPGLPAQRAGLRRGDVVVAFDGAALAADATLDTSDRPIGHAFELQIQRGGALTKITVVPAGPGEHLASLDRVLAPFAVSEFCNPCVTQLGARTYGGNWTRDVRRTLQLAQWAVSTPCATGPVSGVDLGIARPARPDLERTLLDAPLEGLVTFAPSDAANVKVTYVAAPYSDEKAIACYPEANPASGMALGYEFNFAGVGLSCRNVEAMARVNQPLGRGTPGFILRYHLEHAPWTPGATSVVADFLGLDGELFRVELSSGYTTCLFEKAPEKLALPTPMQHPVVVDFSGKPFEKAQKQLAACYERVENQYERLYTANDNANITDSTRANRTEQLRTAETKAQVTCQTGNMAVAKALQSNEQRVLDWRTMVYAKVVARLKAAARVE